MTANSVVQALLALRTKHRRHDAVDLHFIIMFKGLNGYYYSTHSSGVVVNIAAQLSTSV